MHAGTQLLARMSAHTQTYTRALLPHHCAGLYDDVGKGGNMEEKQLYFDREVKRQQKNNVAGAYAVDSSVPKRGQVVCEMPREAGFRSQPD